jgi:hypothetical protein
MNLFRRKKEDKEEKPQETKIVNKVTKNVLVIDSEKHDWDSLFEKVEHDHFQFVVEQCLWKDIQSVTSYNERDSKKYNKRICMVQIQGSPTAPKKHRTQTRNFQPDFVIVRKLVNGLKIKSEDWTHHLQGFLHAQVPSINSFQSIYMNLQRPMVHGALATLRDKYGYENFPLIDQYFYSDPRSMLFHPPTPIVLKVGTAEAGFGKLKVGKENENISEELRDIGGTITRYGDYITAESFIKNKTHDIRVQRIGPHIRAYKRVATNWKGNVGNSILTEIEVLPRYKQWAEWVGNELFGGACKMDILTVDAVGTEGSDQEFILEINDSASGFAPKNEQEDCMNVRDLAIQQMEQLFLNV